MTRTKVLGAIVLAGLLGAAVSAFQAPADAPKVVETEKLRDNLYVLKGGGGNVAAFVTANGVVLIDSKLPGWGQPLLDAVKKISTRPVTTVINTHTHFDHTSGQIEFPATVEIIAQENTKKYMEQANPVYGLPPAASTVVFKEHGGKGIATRTFKDKLTIGKGADQVDLYYFGRAHTGGDAYVVFPALRVMHVGDTFPTRDLPIMDANNGGTGVEFAATLTKAAAVPNVDTLINGHNDKPTTPADLKEYASFITDFVAAAQAAKKAGKSVDDFAASWATPAKYAGYAKANPARLKADAEVIFKETK